MNGTFKDLEIFEKTLWDPRYFIENFCYIVTKKGTFEKMQLNPAQDQLMKIIEKKIEDKEPIRIRILKARQLGFSTFISALGFWYSAMHENSSYAVVAHKESSASSIFEKNKIFYDNLPKSIKPQTDRFSSERISFNAPDGSGLRSRIFFGTAGGGELFRGETIGFVHKSESAFWGDTLGILKKSINATVPYEPFTFIFEETTANGYNEFKDAWDGEDDYTNVFFGWNIDPDYAITPPKNFEPTQKELELMMDYDLTDAQIYWRRLKIRNDFDGKTEWFEQEYPLTPEEAFLASGLSVFEPQTIKEGIKASFDPIEKRDLLSITVREKLHIWEYPEINEKKVFMEKSVWSDDLQQYIYEKTDQVVEQYKEYANYTIGVDTSGMGADWNRISVWHNIKKKKVAAFGKKNMREEELAKAIVEIGEYYHNALVAFESNFSHSLADYIIDLGYENLYITENVTRIDKKADAMRYGWMTTNQSKGAAISALRVRLNEDPSSNPDREFWSEAEYFVMDRSPTGVIVMKAAGGHHDDIVMGDAIGHFVSQSFQAIQTYSRKLVYTKEEPRRFDEVFLGQGVKNKSRGKTILRKGVYKNHA